MRLLRFLCMFFALLLWLSPAAAAPRILLLWKQPPTSTPIAWYAIYKRVPGPVAAWVLVRLLPNDPARVAWSDTAVLPGGEWCYTVRAVALGYVESEASNEACARMP